jgi:hypothetical protein
MSDLLYLIGRVASARKVPVPDGLRLTRGWHAFPIVPHAAPTLLHWHHDGNLSTGERPRLRLSVALDSREEALLEAISLASGRVMARFDIRYAHAFQPFEALLSAQAVRESLTQGLGLRLVQGETPLWLLHDPRGDAEPALMPHILLSTSSGSAAGVSLPSELARLAAVLRLAGRLRAGRLARYGGCSLDRA